MNFLRINDQIVNLDFLIRANKTKEGLFLYFAPYNGDKSHIVTVDADRIDMVWAHLESMVHEDADYNSDVAG
ncbi:MAG: hypothetical protein QOI07_1620 [Verrucomicrobiota bacterium]|jgi:hypothetical protein